jgi:hypothetical protein
MLRAMVIVFDAQLWEWDARPTESWTFVSLPDDESDEIREITAGPRRGFGAVRVSVTVGGTRWRTSIFPGGKDGAYVLPVKKAVRKAENLDIGDIATVTVELVDY